MSKRVLAIPAMVLGPLVFIAVPVVLLLLLVPTRQERFDECLAMADKAGLLETRREDAALICLNNVTRRRSSDEDSIVIIPSAGGPLNVR